MRLYSVILNSTDTASYPGILMNILNKSIDTHYILRLSQESRIEWRNNYLLLNLIFLPLPDYLQLFKALIPFMEYGMQKKLSMLIRANELKHTLSFYNSPYSCNTFKTCSNSSGINANTSLNDIFK